MVPEEGLYPIADLIRAIERVSLTRDDDTIKSINNITNDTLKRIEGAIKAIGTEETIKEIDTRDSFIDRGMIAMAKSNGVTSEAAKKLMMIGSMLEFWAVCRTKYDDVS
jgi:hypothetical protein